MNYDKRLQEMGIQLSEPMLPIANYVPYKIVNDILYVSGQISVVKEGPRIVGKLGASLNVEEGQKAAFLCALNLLSWVKVACNGELNQVIGVHQITVLINASENFQEHPKVANGASDFLVELFGKEKGGHTRIAFGASSLPLGAAVEISGIFGISPSS